MVSTIQQRVSIGLTQARAAECRHIAGEMRLKGLTQIPMMSQLAMWLTDRSHKLEQLGLRMVTEWPIKDEDETPQKEEARVTLQ